MPISSIKKDSFPYEITPLDEKTNKKLLENIQGERTGYVQVGPEKYLFCSKFEQEAQLYYDIEMRSDDVLVVSFPRSGTTLTQELVWLIGNGLNYMNALNHPLPSRFPFLEFGLLMHDEVKREILKDNADSEIAQQMVEEMSLPGWQLLPTMESPRFIKTHFPISLLPKDWTEKKCKTIYVARNPKQVAVSYFYLNKLFRTLGFQKDFDEYWNYFEQNLRETHQVCFTVLLTNIVVLFVVEPWMPYWSHIEEAWRMRNEPNVLFLFYEDIIHDMQGSIGKVAKFLGKTLTDSQIKMLENHLRFDNFRKNASVNLDFMQELKVTNAGQPSFIRNRKSDNAKEEFTEELSRRCDKWMEENMKRIGIRFPVYESK